MIDWKNLLILIACWTLWVIGDSSQISVAALAGQALAPDRSWATGPMATQFIGAALATIPASMLMKYVSRGAGFMCGALLAILGASLAMYAITIGSFNLYVLSTLVIGMFLAFVQLYRFAAAELAPAELRGKAISYVLAGGAIGGLLGPQVANVAAPLFKSPTAVVQTMNQTAMDDTGAMAPSAMGQAAGQAMGDMAGKQHEDMTLDAASMEHGQGSSAVDIRGYRGAYLVYLFVGVLTLGAMGLLGMGKPPAQMSPQPQRPLSAIARQPVFVVGALSAIGSFCLMAMFMAGMTMMMEAMGHTHYQSTWALSGHYFAMYLPALFVGLLAQRFGANKIVLAGAVLYAAGFVVALFGDMMNTVHMWIFLIFLGAGWSAMFIGGTALVTRAYKPIERPKAQGLHDFLLFSIVALGAFSSGKLFHTVGWNRMIVVALAGTAVIIAANLWLMRVQAASAKT